MSNITVEDWELEDFKEIVFKYGNDCSWSRVLTEEEILYILGIELEDIVSVREQTEKCELCGVHGSKIITLGNQKEYVIREW